MIQDAFDSHFSITHQLQLFFESYCTQAVIGTFLASVNSAFISES